MNLKISIFDFFSFLVPGFIYLVSIVLIASNTIDFSYIQRVITPNIQDLVYLSILSYILGQLGDTLYKLNPVTSILYIKVRKYSDDIYDNFIDENNLNRDKYTYRYMRRYITTYNKKLISQIEKHLAMKIFMRNLSLSLVILSLATTFFIYHVNNEISYYLVIILILFSGVSAYKSTKYAKWANRSILDSFDILFSKSNYHEEN